jgi:Family of unknown function (DUF6069)
MSIATTTLTGSSTPTPSAKRHALRRATLASGAVALAAVTAVAAGADAAGVPFQIDGETIPLGGFAQMTVLGAVLGGLIAWACGRFSAEPRRRFVQVALALTALSCVPSIMLPPDTATKAMLVATHVIAAAIIVPALARQVRS